MVLIIIITIKIIYKKRRKQLLIEFKEIKQTSLQLHQSLYDYIMEKNAFDEKLSNGTTLGEYLKKVQQLNKQNLSKLHSLIKEPNTISYIKAKKLFKMHLNAITTIKNQLITYHFDKK